MLLLQLEQKLHGMQIDLENLVRDKKKLQEHFQMAVKERRMMEILLAEIEEEHDMAIAKIEKLEGKVNSLYPCTCVVLPECDKTYHLLMLLVERLILLSL